MAHDHTKERQFSDPIVLPMNAPIPIGVTKYILASEQRFREAEMAALDNLPSSLRKLLTQHNINVNIQLVEKGLHFGEFTEDDVYMAIIRQLPSPAVVRRN